jgi:hypothetical protein
MKKRHHVLYIGSLCIAYFTLCISSLAQVYPIQSQVNLIPPYSGNLSDYTYPGSQRISVTLACKDITVSNYRVKLRVMIEGLGITVRTKQNLIVDPIILEGGLPLTLYGDDLAHYLNPQNLDFIGYSRSEYQRTGKLPEGVYRFSFEVLDYNRSTMVSNKGFTTAWIILNDPPILNLPSNNVKVKIIDPTSIPFTWTPRHTGSPNAAFTSEYIFRLIEIWPSDRNPNDAFLTQAPLYETETMQSQIVYGPGEPALIPGRKYAWQVEARDTEGRDLFKNNGKSEIFVFQFGDAISAPENLREEFANGKTISIRWEPAAIGAIAEKYRIEYRRAGAQTWYQSATSNTWYTMTELSEKTTYDVRVRAEDHWQASDYCITRQFSTKEPKKIEGYECGGPIHARDSITNKSPLLHLLPGDMFRCFDFDVTVQQVTSANGNGEYTGVGWQKVNFFNGAQVYVEFNGKINTEYVLVAGLVKTISTESGAMSSMIEEMKRIGEERAIAEQLPLADSSGLSNHAFEPYVIEGVIDSIFIRDDKIVIVTDAGVERTFENKSAQTGEPVAIKDSAGTMYTVDEGGVVEKAGINIVNNASPKAIDTNNFNEFELLVKKVIDSLYNTKISFRDSVLSIKNADQKKLDDLVGVMQSIEESVQDEVPQIELDISVVELMTDIDLMDSVVQVSVDKVNMNEGKLTTLNQMLDSIKNLTKEIDNAEQLKNMAITQRRLRIVLFIENRLK